MAPIRTTAAHFVRGLLMGGADVVPGISGGTVALIVGIYERLVRSVRAAASGAFHAVRLDRGGARRGFDEVEWSLVLPLGVGIVTALAIGSRVIPGLLETYPEQIHAIFFGLIVGSLAIPWRRIERVGAVEISLVATFAIGAFVVVGLPDREIADPALPLVFAFAAIAICAMILPGVSGAFLLVTLGIYRPTLDALAELNLPYVAVFVAGAVVGLGLFSKLLEWLLEHRHAATMAALLGLMVGALRALWPWLDDERGLLAPPDAGALLLMGGLALAGALFVSVVIWLGSRRRGTATC